MDRANDFAFKIATANGTGSASANGLIMQAIFRMGVPVTGKNVFPSNIQGLPTWYEIRVNKNGYTARTAQFDLMVALNAATYAKDVAEVRSGGWLLYDSSWPLDERLTAPATELTQELFVSGVLKQTGRVMVKDENVCLHCGLCAERCPTYAWDMRKFAVEIPLAGALEPAKA